MESSMDFLGKLKASAPDRCARIRPRGCRPTLGLRGQADDYSLWALPHGPTGTGRALSQSLL